MLSFITGCATGGQYIDDSYHQAKKAYETGKYEEAAKDFGQYITDNPDSSLNEINLYYLGNSYMKLGQLDKAKEAYQKLIGQFKSGFWVELAQKDMEKMAPATQ